MGSLDAILNHAQELEKDMASGQTNMFDLLDMGASQTEGGANNIVDANKPPMSVGEKLRHEKELLSFYVSGHPMSEYAGFDDALDDIPFPDAVRRVKKLPFRACGVVSNIVKRLTKKDNKPWCYFTLSGRSSSKVWQINVFPAAYETCADKFREGDCVCVTGDCRSDESGETRFTCSSIEPMEGAIAGFCNSVEWLIDPYALADRFVKILSNFARGDGEGSDINHKIRVRVGDDEFVEMSDSGMAKTRFSAPAFKKLHAEPAVLAFRAHARPIPLPEPKWKVGGERGAFRR